MNVVQCTSCDKLIIFFLVQAYSCYRPDRQFDVSAVKVYGEQRTAPSSSASPALQRKFGLASPDSQESRPTGNSYQTSFGLAKDINQGQNKSNNKDEIALSFAHELLEKQSKFLRYNMKC